MRNEKASLRLEHPESARTRSTPEATRAFPGKTLTGFPSGSASKQVAGGSQRYKETTNDPGAIPILAGTVTTKAGSWLASLVSSFMWAWRRRSLNARELTMINDRLLRDIGLNSDERRELAKLKNLGRPSRTLRDIEVAQGVLSASHDHIRAD